MYRLLSSSELAQRSRVGGRLERRAMRITSRLKQRCTAGHVLVITAAVAAGLLLVCVCKYNSFVLRAEAMTSSNRSTGTCIC